MIAKYEMTTRYSAALALAILVTFTLFWGMQELIAGGGEFPQSRWKTH